MLRDVGAAKAKAEEQAQHQEELRVEKAHLEAKLEEKKAALALCSCLMCL